MDWEIRGHDVEELAELDAAVKAFMDATETRGAVLAVSHGGRLVHARGFRRREPGDTAPAVEPWQPSRTGSASKVITGIAIERLIEQGHIESGQRVAGLVEPLLLEKLNEAGLAPKEEGEFASRFFEVTVDDLLLHNGGLTDFTHRKWNAKTAELFDHPLPVNKYEIAVHSLRGPAGGPAYSNFGYSLLGMVIEAVAQRPYIEHVYDEILEPLGLWRARQALPLKEQMLPDEIDYWVVPSATRPTTIESRVEPGKMVEWPYGGENVANFDAFGGWVIAAYEYTRLLDALRAKEVPGLTQLDYRDLRTWRQNRYKTAAGTETVDHGAVIMGAAGWVASREDETSIAVFYNTTRNDDVYPVPSYTVAFSAALDAVASWPEHDFYPEFLAKPAAKKLPPPTKLPDDFQVPGRVPLPLAERQRLARLASQVKAPGDLKAGPGRPGPRSRGDR